ncbi:MAG: Lrp/AsnC ligand binding domain-containing protein [Anaerolineae bacterium]|jgi:DNA-binding Lrp family transcriptional regulator
MRAYVLIKTHVGDIYPALGILHRTDGVLSAHATFGPYDIIALVEADGLEELSDLIARQLHGISEIIDTTTCILLGKQ